MFTHPLDAQVSMVQSLSNRKTEIIFPNRKFHRALGQLQVQVSKLPTSSSCVIAKQRKRTTHKRIKLKHRHHLIANLISGPNLSTDPKDWTVTLGEHHLKNEDWFEQSRNVKSIYTHPQYTGGGNQITDQEIKGIPPHYDVGMRNVVVMSTVRCLCFLLSYQL